MKILTLLIGFMAIGLCSFAQLNPDEVAFRNDLKNALVFDLNKVRKQSGLQPVILADIYSQDSDEAVVWLYEDLYGKDSVTDADLQEAHNSIKYKGEFPSGGRGISTTLLFFYDTKALMNFRSNLRKSDLLMIPEARYVSVSILEDQFKQFYVAITSYN
jgi:hypothetical protein